MGSSFELLSSRTNTKIIVKIILGNWQQNQNLKLQYHLQKHQRPHLSEQTESFTMFLHHNVIKTTSGVLVLPSRMAVKGTPSSAFMLITFRATSCPFILERGRADTHTEMVQGNSLNEEARTKEFLHNTSQYTNISFWITAEFFFFLLFILLFICVCVWRVGKCGYLFCFVEMGSCNVAQADIQLSILLKEPAKSQ